MKYKTHLITGACVAAITLCAASPAFGASKKKDAEASPAATTTAAASPAEKAPRAIPFRGTVSAVDASAKTFTIAGKTSSRVFKMTDKTTVTKDGAAATMADLTADTKVTGSYWKQADGILECKSVKIGGAAAAADATSSKKAKKDAGATTSASPSASPSPKK